MADDTRMQTVGDQETLKDGPRSMERKPFGGGQMQAVGSQAPLGTSPVPDQFMHKGVSGGEMQVVGDKVDLKDTPRRGWQSSPGTPMSQRTEFMNKIGTGKG